MTELSCPACLAGVPEMYLPAIQMVRTCLPSASNTSLVIARNVTSVMITPVSFCDARRAHSSSSSPCARRPPGVDHVASPCAFPPFISSTRSSFVTSTPIPIFGRFGIGVFPSCPWSFVYDYHLFLELPLPSNACQEKQGNCCYSIRERDKHRDRCASHSHKIQCYVVDCSQAPQHDEGNLKEPAPPCPDARSQLHHFSIGEKIAYSWHYIQDQQRV